LSIVFNSGLLKIDLLNEVVGAFQGNLPQVTQTGIEATTMWAFSARDANRCCFDTGLGNMREVPVEGSHKVIADFY
jgi:hypothetical protein